MVLIISTNPARRLLPMEMRSLEYGNGIKIAHVVNRADVLNKYDTGPLTEQLACGDYKFYTVLISHLERNT